ncbi:MAG: STAS-like domain-containing protein, partial [Deltaproteobacteria bacterium]
SGIGVFRNIMQKRRLKSELEAIQDLLKGKTTTAPKSHSGEGIFFTSKAGDLFILDSFGHQLIVNNEIPDVFVKTTKEMKRGTRVIFKLYITSKRHLNELFRQYTKLTKDSDYGFDKTKIQVKLYTIGDVHISRSQSRRVLSGLEKFKIIIFDFDKVPVVGQAFADEIFRVFHNKHPHITLEEVNMNEGVKFMVERAKNEAKTLR